MARVHLVSIVLSVLALAGGCKAFDETLLPGGDAGTECVATAPPARPTDGEGDGPERLFALRDVELNQGTGWREIGWDRDGLCTGPPDFEAECRPPLDEDGIEQDGIDGIDNAFGHEVMRFADIFGLDVQDSIRDYQARGIRVTLVRVRGWNGEPNDADVEVTVAAGAFGTADDASGGPPMLPLDGSPPPPPVWDGMDYFWADVGAFVMGDENLPLIRDDRAYVRDGLLVLRPVDRSIFVLAAEDKSLEVLLSDVVMTAGISETGLEDVVLAGRWRGPEILVALGPFGLCPGSENGRRIERVLQIQADLRAMPGTGGEGTICDAISTGIRFQGVRGQWAGIATAPPLVDACE